MHITINNYNGDIFQTFLQCFITFKVLLCTYICSSKLKYVSPFSILYRKKLKFSQSQWRTCSRSLGGISGGFGAQGIPARVTFASTFTVFFHRHWCAVVRGGTLVSTCGLENTRERWGHWVTWRGEHSTGYVGNGWKGFAGEEGELGRNRSAYTLYHSKPAKTTCYSVKSLS